MNSTIFSLNDIDNIGVNYSFFQPKKYAVLKNVNIYVIDLNSIENDSIRKRKKTLLKYFVLKRKGIF